MPDAQQYAEKNDSTLLWGVLCNHRKWGGIRRGRKYRASRGEKAWGNISLKWRSLQHLSPWMLTMRELRAEVGFVNLLLLQFLQTKWNKDRQNVWADEAFHRLVIFYLSVTLKDAHLSLYLMSLNWKKNKTFFFISLTGGEKTWLDEKLNEIGSGSGVEDFRFGLALFLLHQMGHFFKLTQRFLH